jgi:hypothetical protein
MNHDIGYGSKVYVMLDKGNNQVTFRLVFHYNNY